MERRDTTKQQKQGEDHTTTRMVAAEPTETHSSTRIPENAKPFPDPHACIHDSEGKASSCVMVEPAQMPSHCSASDLSPRVGKRSLFTGEDGMNRTETCSKSSQRWRYSQIWIAASSLVVVAFVAIACSSVLSQESNHLISPSIRARKFATGVEARKEMSPLAAKSHRIRQIEEENGDGDAEKEDNEHDSEAENEEDDNDKQEGDGEDEKEDEDQVDDFFDTELNDDLIKTNPIDDFYAFVEAPEQPHLFPLTDREIVGYLIASAALTLGASGGVGGGGIVVPVYLLVMGMGPKVAIPIGAVTVLGGALSSTMINLQRRHPLADRPLIDWDFILVMQPVVLIGVLLGTFIHQLLSEQILIVLLVVLLSVSAHSTLSKAMRMFEAEKRYIRHLKAAQAEPPTGSPSRTFTWGDDELHTMKPVNHQVDDEEKERIRIENPDFVTLRSDLLEEEKFTPNSKIMVVVCVISVLITLNVMVGGGGIESPWGIVCGSPAFWTIHAVMLGFLMVAAWSAQAYLIARHEIKNIVRFDYVHGDIRWNKRAGWLYPIVFMVAGLLAGMFGIGGGVMIVPLLLTIGTHPAVASSTSSAMVLITSLVSTSTYAVFGLILVDFAVVGFFVAFFSSLVGQILMGRLRQARSASGRAFERNSYIAFVIGGVVLISAILMTIQYIFSIVEGPEDEYGGLCDGLTFNT